MSQPTPGIVDPVDKNPSPTQWIIDNTGFLAPTIFLVPLLGLIVYCLSLERTTGLRALGVGLAIFGASTAAGAMLGFLFGIPRTEVGSERSADGRTAYRANTNLEQISDWLTKILVGVGLVELKNAGLPVTRLVDSAGDGLGGGGSGRALALGLMVLYLVIGFLLAYLMTRAVLPKVLTDADRALEEVKHVVAELRDQSNANAQALTLVNDFLDGASADQAALDKVVAAADPATRVTVFAMARRQRREAERRAWRLKPGAERTEAERRVGNCVPVFRALIAADQEAKFHRTHAELGYALKSSSPPDLPGSLAALSEAIRRRDLLRLSGFQIYELNRALVRAMLQGGDKPASEADVLAVVTDLKRVQEYGGASERLLQELRGVEPIKSWAAVNAVDLAPPSARPPSREADG